ncbi:GST-5 protein [Aphelenchoides avenae]|nr:GST-5 protein [Aphelenchus avenae]
MPPKYKLVYFKLRARGEPIRMIFHHAKQEFEDAEVSVDAEEAWPEMKKKTPFGQLPFLEVAKDGGDKLVLAQTTAILRYLGKKLGLEADTFDEQALCDMYAEYVQDTIMRGHRYFWTMIGLEPAEKEPELRESTFLPTVKDFGETIEKQLKSNGTGFIVGKKLTWVDIFIACFVDMYMEGGKDAFSKYPLVEKHRQMVFGQPGIKEYVAKRPNYPY